MNWKTKYKPKHGDVRIRRKFALLPIEGDDGTTYWLESVYVLEEVRMERTFGGTYRAMWVPVAVWPKLAQAVECIAERERKYRAEGFATMPWVVVSVEQ